MNEGDCEVRNSPLCVFYLSPTFSIRAFSPTESWASRRPSTRWWRRGDCSLPSVRPRFKPFNRHAFNSLPKYLAAVFAIRQSRKNFTLQEVLDVIQQVWTSPLINSSNSITMDDKFRKSSSTSNEIPSPILLRRRLSAPETIMRKHMLAQQRSESQDSEFTQSDSKSCQWRSEMDAGSDPNLNRKRDSGLMRKSTLLRRLWSNSKPFTGSRFSGSFYEWQQYGKLSSGKSSNSLNSNHSSPEHLIRSQSKRSLNGNEFRTSPQHYRKLSPKHQIYERKPNNINLSPKRKMSVYNGNFNNNNINSNTEINFSSLDNRTNTPKTTETDSRTTNTSFTVFSDNSDSTFTNNKFLQMSNNNSNSSSEINKQIIEEAEVCNQDINKSVVKLECKNINNSFKQSSFESQKYIKYCNNVSESTQTTETTNLNVISNVHLSQSTLDLIFNQVMQDVQNSTPNNTVKEVKVNTNQNNAVETKTMNVKEVPSFFLKRQDDIQVDNPEHRKIVKYMISNVGTGSPYSKPAEVPQIAIPRFSALPRTASMEVNISSGDSTDKESDTVSLVDSLEDPSLFRDQNLVQKSHDEKSMRGDTPSLPDKVDKKLKAQKPEAFFIPIDNNGTFKAVSDHLPDKVRKKLAKRQQKREEKLQQSKSKQTSPKFDSNYVSASDNGNGNTVFLADNSSDINSNISLHSDSSLKSKKRNKPLLPSIETFRRIKIDSRGSKFGKTSKKPVSENKNKWLPKTKSKTEKLTPLYTTRNEYVYNDGPRKIYHKTEFNNSNKRIEILEIMECIDTSEKLTNQFTRGKSKIPVLINQKLPKISNQPKQKPTYLDFETVPINDSKLDQLIANILIDTLNNTDLNCLEEKSVRNINEKKENKQGNVKYHQKFAIIPEESSHQSSNEDAKNYNFYNNNNQEIENNYNEASTSNDTYQGKAAIAVLKDENFSSIPKGWITFYMLHKNQGSPDSTSDEGKEMDNNNNDENNNEDMLNNKNTTKNNDSDADSIKKGNFCPFETKRFSSSSETQSYKILRPPNGRLKKYNYPRKQKLKCNSGIDYRQSGEWSVTVSGMNPYGQFAPDFELRLKFPDNKANPCQSDSGLAEDGKKIQFPRIETKVNEQKIDETMSEDSYRTQLLPEISLPKPIKKQRRSDASIPLGAISRIEPKQTRTSTRRYTLNRPKIEFIESPTNTLNFLDERHCAEILRPSHFNCYRKCY